MMNEYKTGDEITLERGDERLAGILRSDSNGDAVLQITLALAADVVHMEANGWRVTEHTPKVALPTEPGLYVDNEGDVWRLLYTGEWDCLVDDTCGASDPEFFVPFTRLRLVPEIVLEVTGWFELFSEASRGECRDAREHFGVTR